MEIVFPASMLAVGLIVGSVSIWFITRTKLRYEFDRGRAAGELVQLEHPGIVFTREEAEEVLLDVYTQVWHRAASYSAERGAPLAWLTTIARSRAIDRLRAGVDPQEEESRDGHHVDDHELLEDQRVRQPLVLPHEAAEPG